MSTNENIEKMTTFILQNPKGMIKEGDLRNFFDSDEAFQEIVPEIAKRFQAIGLSLVRTNYMNEKYFVLSTLGKDESISPSMYGALSLLAALYNELGTEMDIISVKQLMKDIWGEIEQLIAVNYLQSVIEKGKEWLKITPIGKSALKNILKELNLKKILEIYETSKSETLQ